MKATIRAILGLFLLVQLFLVGCDETEQYANSKQIIEKYVKLWNTAEFDGIENILHADFTVYSSPNFESSTGIDHFKENIINLHAAFPDFKLVLDEMIIDGDKAAGLWTLTGTKTVQGNTPSSEKSIEVRGMSILHFKDGKIVDEWISGNDLLFLQQLGYTLQPPVNDE